MKKNIFLILFLTIGNQFTSEAQTVLEADINPGVNNSFPGSMFEFNDTLYLAATDSTNDRELWVFNGDTALMAHDINPGSGIDNRSEPGGFMLFDNKIFFVAEHNTFGIELWSFDGDTVVLEADMQSGANETGPSVPFIEFDSKLFFNGSNDALLMELFSYDGSTVALEADIRVGNSVSFPFKFTVYNNILYFTANDGISGQELWRFDGNNASLAADINPGSSESQPDHLIVYNGKLYFSANGGQNERKLWSFDGTIANLEADVIIGSNTTTSTRLIEVYDGNLYFAGTGDTQSGRELWKYDGTNASLVQDIRPGIDGSFPDNFKVYAGKLYFRAFDDTYGSELWKYNGNTAVLAANMVVGGSSSPNNLNIINDKLYFAATDSAHGTELWSHFDAATCSAGFSLYQDTIVPHNWFALNNCQGSGNLNYTWNWGDSTTSSGSNPSHLYDVPGYYNICVTISDGAGCIDTYCDNSTYVFKTAEMVTINVVDQLPAGIVESENNLLNIYPNPVTNILTIETARGKGTYQLQDITGKVLLSGSVTATKFSLDISALSKGIYLLSLIDGEQQVNRKVVKE